MCFPSYATEFLAWIDYRVSRDWKRQTIHESEMVLFGECDLPSKNSTS